MSVFDDITQGLVDYATSGKVKAYAKTNLGPAIPVYTGSTGGDETGLLSALGVRGGIIVTDAEGKTLYTIGDPAPTDTVRSLVFWLLLAVVAVLLLRGLLG